MLKYGFSQEALRKLCKDELFNLPLDYQNKFNSTLANLKIDIAKLRQVFGKIQADLAISRIVSAKLTVSLEGQCWNDSQNPRRECSEISGFPKNINNEDLEGTPLELFQELEMTVDHQM